MTTLLAVTTLCLCQLTSASLTDQPRSKLMATQRRRPPFPSSPSLSPSLSRPSSKLTDGDLPQRANNKLISEKVMKLTSARAASSVVVTSKQLRRDLRRLWRLLPGVYTNTEQYQQEAGKGQGRGHDLLRSAFRPVTLAFLPRAMAALVQDYSGRSRFPFRQRVFAFTPDPPHGALRMKVWTFASPRALKLASRHPSRLHALRRKDLTSHGHCDMLWRRLDKRTFVGTTGKECLGYVQGEQVRISVSMTLTSGLLQVHEGWYARDGRALVETRLPYSLVKTKQFHVQHRSKQQASSPHTPDRRHNDLPESPPPGTPPHGHRTHSNSVMPHRHSKASRPSSANRSKQLRSRSRSPDLPVTSERGRQGGLLSNYSAVAQALQSGRLVFYSVELSACSLPQQMQSQRLSFGDFVDSFESRPGSVREAASVRFWQNKYVQGDEGMEEVTREVTINSDNRVQVRLLRKQIGSNSIVWDQLATCKIFDPDTSLGGIKLTAQAGGEVGELSTYNRLRATLRRGRRQVRMVVDLSLCHGSSHGDRNIVGATIRAYDFINSGRAVEVSQAWPVGSPGQHRLLVLHFLHNGHVMLVSSLQPDSHHDIYVQQFAHTATFRCALPASANGEVGPAGVRLFYSTH